MFKTVKTVEILQTSKITLALNICCVWSCATAGQLCRGCCHGISFVVCLKGTKYPLVFKSAVLQRWRLRTCFVINVLATPKIMGSLGFHCLWLSCARQCKWEEMRQRGKIEILDSKPCWWYNLNKDEGSWIFLKTVFVRWKREVAHCVSWTSQNPGSGSWKPRALEQRELPLISN